jgi:protein-S-isoprenylcysteine O-methyltransferase Ste14
MNLTLLLETKPLLALVLISIAIIPSIFLGPKVMGMTFLVYIVVLAWCMVSLFGKNIIPKTFDALETKAEEEKEENKIVTSAVYSMVGPFIFIGLIVVFIIIFSLIFVM